MFILNKRALICTISVTVTSVPSKHLLWVRVPYGAPFIGIYFSLVEGMPWEHKAAGSNPAVPTIVGSSFTLPTNRSLHIAPLKTPPASGVHIWNGAISESAGIGRQASLRC